MEASWDLARATSGCGGPSTCNRAATAPSSKVRASASAAAVSAVLCTGFFSRSISPPAALRAAVSRSNSARLHATVAVLRWTSPTLILYRLSASR
eukprot:scaffold41800_cov258-Isochrysis_galbana.AAC.1